MLKQIFCLILGFFSLATAQNQCLSTITGSPFAAGSSPARMSFSPVINNKLFLGVANAVDSTATVYTVDIITGVLTQVTGSPFATITSPAALNFSPFNNGKLFASVVNANSLAIYDVNIQTGALSQITGSPFTLANPTFDAAYSPIINDKLFIATVNFTQQINIYSVDTSTGAISSAATGTTGLGPRSVAFSNIMNGKLFVATANSNGSSISVFQVNTQTGALTPVTGSPFSVSGFSMGVAISPEFNSKAIVLSSDNVSNGVTVFSMNTATGELTVIQALNLMQPKTAAFSPVINEKLYAAIPNVDPITNDGVLSIFSVDASTGQLTETTQSPIIVGQNPQACSISPYTNNQLFLTVANGNADNVSATKMTFAPILRTAEVASCNSSLITVTGSSIPLAIITIQANQTVIGTGQANSSGIFSILSSTSLAPGNYTITVIQDNTNQIIKQVACNNTSNSLPVTIQSCPAPNPGPSANTQETLNMSALTQVIREKYLV